MPFGLPPVSSISPEILQNLIFESALYIIILLGILAFFGYRLFRYFLVIGGAVLSGIVAYTFLTPLLLGALNMSAPSQFLLPVLMGFLFALVGGLLVNRFVRPSIFIFTVAIGFFVGLDLSSVLASAPWLAFLATTVGSLVFASLFGLLLGLISIPFFKPIFIFLTSVGGLSLAGYVAAISLMSENSPPFILYLLIALGALIGVFAMVYQFRSHRTPSSTDDEEAEASDY